MSEANLGMILLMVPAIPALAAVLGYLLRRYNRLAGWLGIIALMASSVLAALILPHEEANFTRPWLTLPNANSLLSSAGEVGGITVPFAFNAGVMQLLFVLTTALIGGVVMVFALRERRDDPAQGLFYAHLTMFAASMLLFLTADTLLIKYIAWELMGLASYLLIAHKGTAEARGAARRAFWTTRATDFGLLFGIIILMIYPSLVDPGLNWSTLSAINVSTLLTTGAEAGFAMGAMYANLGAVALLLLLAVIGKSAQLPLSFWLPDAMVAPAPVSALLHAATMVAAGPFLMVALDKLFILSETTMILCTVIGGLTLLLGAVMALCADDPKRVLAYSTVSHLGLVVVSISVFANESGYFHLMAHAWFKAALFLGAGYLAAVAGSRGGDTSLSGLSGSAAGSGLVKWGILVPAGISLMGFPFVAGALGKEQVLYALFTRGAHLISQDPAVTIREQFPAAHAGWAFGGVLLLTGMALTAAYAVRLVGILAWGKPQAAPVGDDTPPAAKGWGLPLILTSVMALVGSVGLSVFYFVYYKDSFGGAAGSSTAWRWGEFSSPGFIPVFALGTLAVLGGAGLAWYLKVARPDAGGRLKSALGLEQVIMFFSRGMYLREFWATAVGGTGEFLAVVSGRADTGLIDWLAVRCGMLGRLLAKACQLIDDHVVDRGRWLFCEVWWWIKRLHERTMQTGQIQHYMFIVLLAAVILCFVVAKPLATMFGQVLAPLYEEGLL